MLEHRLPAPVLALADRRHGESAWRRTDLPALAQAASAAGLATFGGQVQIRLRSGVHELYWQDYDPTPRRPGERWPDFVDRSWKELLFLVADLPPDDQLAAAVGEGDPAERLNGLWFVVYLEAGPGADEAGN